MQGRVIELRDGQGRIMADDGQTYAFTRSDLTQSAELTFDAMVDFVPIGDRATQIVTLSVGRSVQPQPRHSPDADDDIAYRGPYAERRNLPPRVQAESFPGFFVAAITKRYADFNGRARRSEYWSFVLFSWLLLAALFLGPIIADPNTYVENSEPSTWAIMLMSISMFALLALTIPGLAVGVRRLHDVGMSGWLILLLLIPSIGSIFMFVVALIPSQKTTNKWGHPPL